MIIEYLKGLFETEEEEDPEVGVKIQKLEDREDMVYFIRGDFGIDNHSVLNKLDDQFYEARWMYFDPENNDFEVSGVNEEEIRSLFDPAVCKECKEEMLYDMSEYEYYCPICEL